MRKLLLTLISVILALPAFAADMTVKAYGEAQIVNNDISAAKIQAQSRARWAAMEEAAQVKVNVASIIHNAELLDESVKSEVSGSITDFKINDEGRDGDIYWVQANVTVKPDNAKETIAGLSKNTSIAVYFPMIFADGTVEENHPFSEKLIQDLIDKGFDVVDMAAEADSDFSKELYDATVKSDTARMRALAARYMAGYALMGKVKVVDKGNNVGYATITFSIVDGELDYRLIGDKNGKRSILTTGTTTGRGQGATVQAAAYAMSKNLASRNSPQIASAVSTKLLGDNMKSIRITLAGNTDIRKFNDFRDMIKNISWVLNVKETSKDSLIVDYPEKTLYLATIINTKGGYMVKNFTDTEIIVYPR